MAINLRTTLTREFLTSDTPEIEALKMRKIIVTAELDTLMMFHSFDREFNVNFNAARFDEEVTRSEAELNQVKADIETARTSYMIAKDQINKVSVLANFPPGITDIALSYI